MKILQYIPFLMLSLALSLFSVVTHAEPMIWKATKGKQHLMLIGTIHLGKEDMYPLPKQFEDFLKQSNGVVVEVDLEEKMPVMDFSNSKRTSEILNSNQTEQLIEVAESLDIKPRMLLQFPPWVSSIFITQKIFQNLGYDELLGVDQIIQNQAQALNIPLLTLETLADQLNLMKNLPLDGADLLFESINNEKDAGYQLNCLVQYWENGDKEGLLNALYSAEWNQQTTQLILDNRNKKWKQKIKDPKFLSPSGRYVIAVGTLHLIGSNNLIDDLKQRGYHIELITKPQKSTCQTHS